jgi:hypothetical protein
MAVQAKPPKHFSRSAVRVFQELVDIIHCGAEKKSLSPIDRAYLSGAIQALGWVLERSWQSPLRALK